VRVDASARENLYVSGGASDSGCEKRSAYFARYCIAEHRGHQHATAVTTSPSAGAKLFCCMTLDVPSQHGTGAIRPSHHRDAASGRSSTCRTTCGSMPCFPAYGLTSPPPFVIRPPIHRITRNSAVGDCATCASMSARTVPPFDPKVAEKA